MEARAAKLALARKKLKDHQEKKINVRDGNPSECYENITQDIKSPQISQSVNLPDMGIRKQSEVQNVSYIDQNQNNDIIHSNPEVDLTELLVTSKRNLELKNNELQLKVSQLENGYSEAVNNYNSSKQHIAKLEKNLRDINNKYMIVADELSTKDKAILNLNVEKSSLSDVNSNLQDQLEYTKNVLAVKETENLSLQNQLRELQNQLDATQLQLQQITNGSFKCPIPNSETDDNQLGATLQQKISILEQQLNVFQKERDQLTSHYEHYVSELNNQIKSLGVKNEELIREVQNLTNREISLIDQISDMEIRLQNYHAFKEAAESKTKPNDDDFNELQQKYAKSMEIITDLTKNYEDLQRQLSESEAKVQELSLVTESKCHHDEISITKLTADIASDKIAAQKATEQNRKLKTDVQDLEGAFIKLSRDKLELVEKLSAEKYLNRELTIKLAEIEENAKEMHIKLRAKDEEMIRLQNKCRETEKQLEQLSEDLSTSARDTEVVKTIVKNIELPIINNHDCGDEVNGENNVDVEEVKFICDKTSSSQVPDDSTIPKEHAMLKLQERFLKIMEEVADLSDEKHRLEHIILQLQNETDTICEYVALYQQQRSLLKKRDEERSAQIKIFQTECDRLRKQLEELGAILLRFSVDSRLSSYFQDKAKQADMEKVLDLLTNLKQNTLIDPKRINLDLNNFYPCSCCSGQLIDV